MKQRKLYDGKRNVLISLNTVSCNCSIPFYNCRQTVFLTLTWHMIIGTCGHVWCGRMVLYGRMVPYGRIVPYGRMVPYGRVVPYVWPYGADGRIGCFGGRITVLSFHFDYLPLDSNSRTNF